MSSRRYFNACVRERISQGNLWTGDLFCLCVSGRNRRAGGAPYRREISLCKLTPTTIDFFVSQRVVKKH